MSKKFADRLKREGNVNRITELTDEGCNAEEVKSCFALGGIKLKVVQGDFPIIANDEELCRKALPKAIVKSYLRDRNMSCPLVTV